MYYHMICNFYNNIDLHIHIQLYTLSLPMFTKYVKGALESSMFAFFINTDRFKSTCKICFIYSNKNLNVLTLQTNLYLIPAEIFSPSTTLSGLTACPHSTHVDLLIRSRRALSQTRNLLSLRSLCSSLMSSLKLNRIL